MKKALIFLLLLITFQAIAQTNPITSINISLPANPDANTANWGTGVSQLTITATGAAINGRVNGFVVESKILVIIKKNGAKICGAYTSSTAPSSNFNTLTKVWSGSNTVSLLGQSCILPPGDYELSVQFFGYSNGKLNPLSDEKLKTFTIRGNEQQSYQAPQVITPANETIIKEVDISKPITFRWTPVIPRPQEPVTYRLRVWQLMEGQNGTQARTVNQPVITKDIDNLTQAIISNLITGPCKPPYLCNFVWNVQALNREGKPIGANNGTSENFAFSFSSTDKKPPMISLVSPANGSTLAVGEWPTFRWTITVSPVNDAPTASYKIKIVEIMGDQSPEQALRTNKPIFEKDSLKEIFYYPSTAPTLKSGKKYAWAVGSAPPSMFQMASCDVNLSLKLRSVECLPDVGRNKRYKINFSSTYASSTYNLTFAQSGSGFTAYHPSYSPNYSITNISPTLQTQNSGAGSTVNYSVEVSVPVGQTAIKIGLQGDDKDPGPITCKPGAELDVTLPVCEPACECGEWGDIKVKSNAPTIPDQSYKCGKEIVWKCNKPLSFSDTFNCKGTDPNCAATTIWTVSKDGKIVKEGTGANSITGSFTPTENGTYTITLNAKCGKKECLPCTFYIIVKDCIDCDCGKWRPLKVSNPTGSLSYDCGTEKPIVWNCKKPFNFSSSYLCSQSNEKCTAKTRWTVSKDGKVVQQGTGTNSIEGSFTPIANGTYILTLDANCGDKECKPCTYTIIVKDCIDCDCGKWGSLQVSNGPGSLKNYDCGTEKPIVWNCKKPFYFVSTYKCSPSNQSCAPKITWTASKDGKIVQQGAGPNGIKTSFTPTENGTYTLTLNANCGGKDCEPCIYTIVVDDCKACDCGEWGNFKIKGVVTTTAGASAYKCGKEMVWKCNTPLSFSNTFNCKGTDPNCAATTTWTVSKNGKTVKEGTGVNSIAGSFTPTENGTYTITLNAKCGKKECLPCTLYIIVKDCPPPLSCVTPPKDMVAWWTFDEKLGQPLVDRAGFANNGTGINGPLAVPAKVAGGLKFNGTNYVDVPDHAELDFGTGDFSFDAWIQTSDAKNLRDLVDKRTTKGYLIYLINGKLGFLLRDGSTTNYNSPVYVADGKWHHIAITVARKDKKGITFYLDGVPTKFGDPTLQPGNIDNTSKLRIGKDLYSDSYNFKGILDEIELFNRVLAKDEVVSIFKADKAGKCKDAALVCDCGKWDPLQVRNATGSKSYDCGTREAILWNCNKPFDFSSTYKCSSNNETCTAKTQWTVTKDGKIVKEGTGANEIAGSFTPTENGTYTLTLNANCGGKDCEPCTYTIVVEDCRPPVDLCKLFCNTDFEQFVNIAGPTTSDKINQKNIPCWKTTARDSRIEIWHSGNGNVPAHSGDYFAELNSSSKDTLYQTFSVTSATKITVSFAHRGRYAGYDKLEVVIVSPNGTSNVIGTSSANNTGWTFTNIPMSYTIPSTALGTYILQFRSVSSNNGVGPNDGGNFIDAIKVTCEDVPPVCDCGKWGSLNVRTELATGVSNRAYECGSRINWSCKQPLQFTSNYTCTTTDANCIAKTTWEVRKGETLIKSGTGTNTLNDGFSLLTNGTYTLTLNAKCGDNECKPCTYTIIVENCRPPIDPCASLLCNTDFEQFVNISGPAKFVQTNQNNIPCWKTTATDSKIEIWRNGFQGVQASSGNYFAELNASQLGTLYQNFTATASTTATISFAHRGRYNGDDSIQVFMDTPNGSIPLGIYTANNTGWITHTLTPIPIIAGSSYSLQFKSISSNGGKGPKDGGNFLDAVKVTCSDLPPVVTCNCNEKPWDVVQKVKYYDDSRTVGQEIRCLGKIERKIKLGSKITYYVPTYNCDKQDCKATYSWKIIELSKGTVYSSGTTTSFPINITAPTIGGDYKFEVTPFCGTTTCRPCGFNFTVAR